MKVSGKFLALAILAIFAGGAPAWAELREVKERPAAVANTPEGQGVSPTWTVLKKADLVRALRGGGHVIACRHGMTDWKQNDRPEAATRPDDRSLQRNLTEAGLVQGREIGAAIQALKIPIASIKSTYFLRTRNFAALAFVGKVTIEEQLLSRGPPEPQFRAILGTVPPAGNVALVTHHNTFYAAGLIATNEIEEGGCLIVKPEANGRFAIVAHLAPRDWTELARAYR